MQGPYLPISLKNGLLLCLGVHLQLSPVNLAEKIFFRPGGARAPIAPPGYAYANNNNNDFLH